MDQLLESLKGLDLASLAPWALFAVAAAVLFWPQIQNWWGSRQATATGTTATTAAPDDVADMQALKLLTARYTRLKCPEGIAAMQTAGTHFFHEPPQVVT